jgi:hypothetical protein
VHHACKNILHGIRLKKEKEIAENEKQKKAMKGKIVTTLLKPKINFWTMPEEVNEKSLEAKK